MQETLFNFEEITPPAASPTKRRRKADPEPIGPPTFALFQSRLMRWTTQAAALSQEQADAANAWFRSKGFPLIWKPIESRKTFVVRR